VSVVNAHADQRASRAELVRAQGALRAAIGPGARRLPTRIALDLDEAPELPSISQLLAELGTRRGDLRAADARAQAARLGVDLARRAVWPGISVAAYAAYGQNPGELDLGFQLLTPLPVTNRGQGRLPAAEAIARAHTAQRDALRAATLLRIEQAHERAELLRENARAFVEAGVQAGAHLLAEAQLAYIHQHFSALGLTDAYAAWRDTHLRTVAVSLDARKAELDLARLLGRSLRSNRPAGAPGASTP